jgi:hypothetical protein
MTTRVRSLSPDVVVAVTSGDPSIDRGLRDRIQAVWTEERSRRPELFDGTLFACDSVDDAAGTVVRLKGHFVPYSWYVAARADDAIARMLNVRVLGVSAILRCRDGIVLGWRATTTSESGLLELVPSGAVDSSAVNGDRVEVQSAVLGELDEELGLSEADLEGPAEAFALVEDDDALLFEAGFRMSTARSFADIERAQAALAAREHDKLQLLRLESSGVIDAPDFSSTSAALLRAAGLA